MTWRRFAAVAAGCFAGSFAVTFAVLAIDVRRAIRLLGGS